MKTTPIPPTTPPQVPAHPVPAAAYVERDPLGLDPRLVPIQAFDFYPKEKQ